MKYKADIIIEKNARTYTFSMEIGCPIGEAYDACFQVLQEIQEFAKQALENAKPKQPDESGHSVD